MLHPSFHIDRILLVVLLLGNAVAFAGVDPPTRALTAILVVVLALQLRPLPKLRSSQRIALSILAGLAFIQLLPLPQLLRGPLQPGLAGVTRPGWFSLSVAPWATLEASAIIAVAVVLGLTAARMTATRSGTPFLLTTLAAVGGTLALLGLGTEHGLPDHVLLFRPNTGGGGPYGPFVNRNHFALAVELTIPAAVALLAAAARHLKVPGEGRRRAAVALLGAGVIVSIELAALLRSGSRGGILFLLSAFLLTLPLWKRRRRALRWPWMALASILVVASVALAFNRTQMLHDRFNELFAIRGMQGNTRLDLWAGTLKLWERSPVVGCGLGAYAAAIGLDKPPTGALHLDQAHNDWLELLADGGLIGAAALVFGLAGLFLSLRPGRVRPLRFEYRYPAAAAALVLVACALHELVGFGLQTPLNAYLLATWVGWVWGFERKTSRGREGEVERAEG